MNYSVMEFFILNTKIDEFREKKVIEVGSKYVNGSVRPFVERFLKPKQYIGVDIEPGEFVDLVLPAEALVDHFGEESFDVAISTELLEHVEDWRLVIENIKKIIRRGGMCTLQRVAKGSPSIHAPTISGDLRSRI